MLLQNEATGIGRKSLGGNGAKPLPYPGEHPLLKPFKNDYR